MECLCDIFLGPCARNLSAALLVDTGSHENRLRPLFERILEALGTHLRISRRCFLKDFMDFRENPLKVPLLAAILVLQ